MIFNLKNNKFFTSMVILFFGLGFSASAQYVFDEAGLVSEDVVSSLNASGENIERQHDVGIYVITVPSMEEYGYNDIYRFGEACYKDMELGSGYDNDGLLYVISMENSDFDVLAYGDKARSYFSDSRINYLMNDLLPDMSDGNWDIVFADYYNLANDYLNNEISDIYEADYSNTEQRTSAGGLNLGILQCLIPAFILSFIIGLITCFSIRSTMKNVKIGQVADQYVNDNDVVFNVRKDSFSHKDVSRTKIETNNNSHGGGPSVSSGGFSHHGGKF